MSPFPSGLFSWQVAALVALLGGGYYLHQNFEVEGLESLSVHRRGKPAQVERQAFEFDDLDLGPPMPTTAGDTATTSVRAATAEPQPGSRAEAMEPSSLLVASWALAGFGPEKLRDAEVMQTLGKVIRRFDVVALQQVRVSQRDFLSRLAAALSRDGRRYDYLATSELAAATLDGSTEQQVFLFDTARVLTDRSQLYTVADPEGRLTHQPLVGWFRAAQLPAEQAWTFSLVNMRVELSRARQELQELPRLIAAIRADGRGEDDIILAGLFQADAAYLTATLQRPSYWLAASSGTTDVAGEYQSSNLLLDRRWTSEAMLRGGALDFLRVNNLSLAAAMRVSSHLPVYAEFSPREG